MTEGPVLHNDGHTPFNLSNSTLKDAFNSNHMKQMRKDFLDGKKPSNCKKCWDEEDTGITSKRLVWAEQFSHKYPQLDYVFTNEVTDKNLIYLDLKLGTICNLKCRICGPMSSSKWAQDEMDIAVKFEGVQKKDVKDLQAYKWLKQGNWPRENDTFWSNLEDILPNVVHLEFTGGEPWLINEHFEVLEKAVKDGYAKNIYVHYNTNGTQLPIHALENIWPHFKGVKASFSIDDTEKKFEYQRYGANWDEVNYNINYICNNKLHNMTTEICTTISLFNINSLIKLQEWVRHIDKLDTWYLNLMHQPGHFNISILPDKAKDEIAYGLLHWNWNAVDRLTAFKQRDEFVTQIKHIVDYMYTHKVDNYETIQSYLFDQIFKVDWMRREKFHDIDPRLAELIGYNYTLLKRKWHA
jgi:organic radical activating enzyme